MEGQGMSVFEWVAHGPNAARLGEFPVNQDFGCRVARSSVPQETVSSRTNGTE